MKKYELHSAEDLPKTILRVFKDAVAQPTAIDPRFDVCRVKPIAVCSYDIREMSHIILNNAHMYTRTKLYRVNDSEYHSVILNVYFYPSSPTDLTTLFSKVEHDINYVCDKMCYGWIQADISKYPRISKKYDTSEYTLFVHVCNNIPREDTVFRFLASYFKIEHDFYCGNVYKKESGVTYHGMTYAWIKTTNLNNVMSMIGIKTGRPIDALYKAVDLVNHVFNLY